ncbi:Mitochondrial distribution and morphology protein 31, mitochondrial precursor, partial [Podila epicladia]
MVKGTAHILSGPQPKATSSLLEAGQRGFSQLHLNSCPLAKLSSPSITRGKPSRPLSTRHFSTDHSPTPIARASNLSTLARTRLAPASIRLRGSQGSKRSYASETGVTPNSSQSALVKYTPPTGPLDRVDRAKLLSAAPTFLARLKIRLKLLLMRQIRPWRVDDFIAMFSWAFMANVAFVLLGTTTFFSLILATAN